MAPRKVILLACGSFNPPTNMHLRMFGKFDVFVIYFNLRILTIFGSDIIFLCFKAYFVNRKQADKN